MTLYELLAERARKQPEKTACLKAGSELSCSYGALLDRIGSAAVALEQAGAKAGDCIGLHCGSGLDYIVWVYACWKLGAAIVPIAVELTSDEKLEICENISLDGIVGVSRNAKVFAGLRDAEEVALPGGMVFLKLGRTAMRPEGFDRLNPAFVRFTSGTTGSSKGVILSHETVRDRITAANDALQIGPEDRVVWLLSMSYHFTVSIVAYLTFGATIILCGDHFGETIVNGAREHDATLIYGSPQHYRLMASDREGAMLPSLRLAISTASALKPEIAASFAELFGTPLSQAYGIIEIGLPCINLAGEGVKPGSVGKPLPAYELRLRDIGHGEGMRAIDIRGRGMLDAYYEPWRLAEEIMPEGWFETGDLGRMDGEGYLFIVGRSKEMISVGGMKFFPQEVEALLDRYDAIAQSCVLVEPHDRLGEVPYALVQLKPGREQPTAEELRRYCAAHLSPFKVPQRFEFASALPKTASGKLKRRPNAPETAA